MVTKAKTVWFCAECGHKSQKWVGQCPSCSEWNSFSEEIEVKETRYTAPKERVARPLRLKEINQAQVPRILTKIEEFDRLVGGGVVPGCLMLVGGEPGVGKSTLMLQLAATFASQGLLVLYVTGEESIEQTSMRAFRLNVDTDNLLLLNETSLQKIKGHIEQLKPDILVIDSIQVIYKDEIASSPGSVTQVRECAAELMHLAKGQALSTFLVGHVTKSGEIAGPRVLEHLVDTVLYFEGDRQHNFRMVRVVKNRFGATDEIAVFEMRPDGLRQVPNPSQIFLQEREKQVLGSVVIATVEGSRPLLIEAQALVTKTAYPTPSRKSTGLDQNRLALLLAVLEKRMRYQLYQCDVFVSIAGGLKITETSVDLGVLLSIASSYSGRIVDPFLVVIGEVGLSGEVRGVSRIESRIKEAIHMGFKTCLIPKRNVKAIPPDLLGKIKVFGVDLVEDAIDYIMSH
jgi:DNA repair protein RadA/Sms